MKKVLYIDLFSQYGHSNLNKVFISRFENLGYDLNYVVREGYIEELEISKKKVVWAIPEKYFSNSFGKLKGRFIQYKMLTYIKNNISTTEYELLFFSFFEEISFGFANLKGNIVLMNHSNISGLTNRFKLFFLKKSSTKAKILVFHESIKVRLSEFGINHVIVEPLGLFKAYPTETDLIKIEKLRKIDDRLLSVEFEFRILIPTASKYDNSFISEVTSNPTFLNFLKTENILLIVKDKSIQSSHKNVLVIDSFLSDDSYKSIFMISDTLLLHYPHTFEYKISAALFECFANYKPVLLSNIASFKAFNAHFEYQPFYENQEQLIESINELKHFLSSSDKRPIYRNLDALNPTLNSIFQ